MVQVKELFEKIDLNGDGSITQAEATSFWGKNWAKVNAQAMFNEVDDDGNSVHGTLVNESVKLIYFGGEWCE